MVDSIKRTVRVTIEKEIEIELMPTVFHNMTEQEYLDEFRKGLWHVDSMDDVVKYAAEMAAKGSGYEHDGLGLVDYSHTTYPRVPDVKFREISDECESEIIERPVSAKTRRSGMSTPLTACACMGPMYGEPHCYCQMKSMGLPMNEAAREIARKRFDSQMKALFEPGGPFHHPSTQDGSAKTATAEPKGGE